jgi:hypothetical protein
MEGPGAQAPGPFAVPVGGKMQYLCKESTFSSPGIGVESQAENGWNN